MRVWRAQPADFFDEAVIDADGTVVETTGECKEGMDIAYNGMWGYHPLLVSLANTGEPLYLVNRSGNRPPAEGAAERFESASSRATPIAAPKNGWHSGAAAFVPIRRHTRGR